MRCLRLVERGAPGLDSPGRDWSDLRRNPAHRDQRPEAPPYHGGDFQPAVRPRAGASWATPIRSWTASSEDGC